MTVELLKKAVRRRDATGVGSLKAPGSLLTTRVGSIGAADCSYAGDNRDMQTVPDRALPCGGPADYTC
jgi:hypothetical protein